MQEFDGAAGDFGIFADRFKYVDFSEPYLDNAAVMIVKEKALKWTKLWLFMKAFTAKMWLIMLSMHVFISSSIWLIERKHNEALKGIGNMLWFSVSVIFYVHSKLSSIHFIQYTLKLLLSYIRVNLVIIPILNFQ